MRSFVVVTLLVALVACGCARDARVTTSQPAGGPALAGRSAASAGPSSSATESSIVHDKFDALWNACERAARTRLFPIERTDYRAGVLTTRPMISKQFFELWRTDAVTAGDVAESSLATIRRTVRFDIQPTPDGKFRATPSVLVERYSAAERRITSAYFYRSTFRRQATQSQGTRESDRGVYLPGRYWYELGHDAALERELRENVAAALRRGR